MPPSSDGSKIRFFRIALWLALVACAIYLYFFERTWIQAQLQRPFYTSLLLGGLVYLFAGCLRGFTLIPSTYLIFVGLPFFRPAPLFLLTIGGILVSSASIYIFSRSFHFEEYFERKHPRRILAVRSILRENELPVIIGWSFFPFAPTDLICYACGIMEVDFWKFLFGILIGEGTISGIYIFFGDHLLRILHLRF